MHKVFIILISLVAICAGVLVYQATHTTRSLVFVPSEILAHDRDKDLERIRVGGKVSSEPFQYALEPEFVLSFHVEDLSNPKGSIPVVYKGLKPEMFSAGRNVIIDGDYRGGTLIATKLLTQCPSKYEPPLPKEKTNP